MISFAQGKLTRIESITRIRKDYYAVCSFEDGNGDEFKRSVNHKHWPLQHLYKFKGVIFIFTISSEDEFDLLPLEFQPEFIKLQLFNRLLKNGNEKIHSILSDMEVYIESFSDYDSELVLELSNEQILLEKIYNKQTKEDEELYPNEENDLFLEEDDET